MSFFVSANATGAVPCPADTTPSFDLTSTPVIAISSIAVLTTAVSYASVFMHFRNLEYQRQQFHIILILLFPAVYTLFSWLSFALWRGAIAESLLLIRDCYDAVVIYAFYQVLLLYIAPTTAGQKAALVPKRISHPFFPRTRIPMDPSRPTFLSRNKAIVYAFCIGRVLMTFVAIVAEWKGAYCGRINSFKYVHSWYVLVTFSTLLPAIYAIVTLEGLFSRELEGKHIMRKLIAVKGILLVILVQSNLLSFLDASGRMTFTSLWTLSRFECLLVVCEMLVSSLVLGAFFSYREFKEAKVLTVVELEGVGNSASEFVRVQRAQEYYGTH